MPVYAFFLLVMGICTSSGILFDCRAKLVGIFKVIFVIVYCCHFLACVYVRVCAYAMLILSYLSNTYVIHYIL